MRMDMPAARLAARWRPCKAALRQRDERLGFGVGLGLGSKDLSHYSARCTRRTHIPKCRRLLIAGFTLPEVMDTWYATAPSPGEEDQ